MWGKREPDKNAEGVGVEGSMVGLQMLRESHPLSLKPSFIAQGGFLFPITFPLPSMPVIVYMLLLLLLLALIFALLALVGSVLCGELFPSILSNACHSCQWCMVMFSHICIPFFVFVSLLSTGAHD